MLHLRMALNDLTVVPAGFNDLNVQKYDVAIVAAGVNYYPLLTENPFLIVGLVKPYQRAAWHLPDDPDFVISENSYMHQGFIADSIQSVLLKTIDTKPDGLRHSPWAGQFTSARPAVLCYHGERHAFLFLMDRIAPLLIRLSSRFPLVLLLVTNGREDASTRHMESLSWFRFVRLVVKQHSAASLFYDLQHCDVGLASNLAVADDQEQLLRTSSAAHGSTAQAIPFIQLGVPLIADASSDVTELLLPHRVGFVVEFPGAWERYLHDLLAEPALRARLSAAQLQFAGGSLSPASEASKLLSFVLCSFAKRIPR